MSLHETTTPALASMVRALMENGDALSVTVDAISGVYRRGAGHIPPGSSADFGMTGAAIGTLNRLERAGLVKDGRITPAGHVAGRRS